ncbi:MAG: hypothetical protein AB1696_17665 [Planctomycetota bacterium]
MKRLVVIGVLTVSVLAVVCYVVQREGRKPPHQREIPENGSKTGLDTVVPSPPATALDRIVPETEENVEQPEYETSVRDPGQFVRMWPDGAHGFTCHIARQCYTMKDLPRIYPLLEDPTCDEYWGLVVQLIGAVSDLGNAESVKVLADYLRRPDNAQWAKCKKNDTIACMVIRKTYALQGLGMVGGNEATEVLENAFTPEGAAELAKEWIEEAKDYSDGGKEGVVAKIRGQAAQGIVYLQNPRLNRLLDQVYDEEFRKWCEFRNGRGECSWLFGDMVEAMAAKAFIAEKGLEEWSKIDGSFQDQLNTLSPYRRKYMRIE